MRYAGYSLVLQLQLILSTDRYRWPYFLRSSSLSELDSDYYDTTNSIRSVTRSFGISLSLFFSYRTSVDSVETVGANAMTKVADDFS